MNLTTKIFKTFLLIFLAQISCVGIWGYFLFSEKVERYPSQVITSLTKIDPSIFEGIILQEKMGSMLSRDLLIYRLIELNNLDSAEYLKPLPFSDVVQSLKLKDCIKQKTIMICSRMKNKILTSLVPLNMKDEFLGYLKLEKSISFNEEINKKILETIFYTILAVFFLNAITLIIVWWFFLKPETSRLLRVIHTEKEDSKIKIYEFKKIQESFLSAIYRVKVSEAEKANLMSEVGKINLANQVAHDIRSPLEMLKSIKEDLAFLPEASRRRIQLGVNRIEEITFNLLKENKHDITSKNQVTEQELLGLVTSIITEKKIEFRNRVNIEIVDHLGHDSYGLFSKVIRSKLKSIISNIINNAVEAIGANNGTIEIYLESKCSNNFIRIKDNGQGIPSDTAKRIFTKGFTTKPSGNGLGLVNAKQDIEYLGGSLSFESEVGKGTTFIISLPKSEIPAIFLDAIHAYKYDRIIILDDDPAFHDVLTKRLDGLENKIEHIYSVEEMFKKYQALHPKILLLSDFELMDKDFDGIDVIQKLNHTKDSVLVTARSEEVEIQERCLEAEIKLLPKSLVNYVKVYKDTSSLDFSSSLTDANNWDGGDDQAETRTIDTQDTQKKKTLIVLIDDDKLVHYSWSYYCDSKGFRFKGFFSIDKFLQSSHLIDKESKIYIDSNLGDGIKGEIESEKIFKLGFKNLYLATGYGKEYIKKPDWIIEVYSKSPEIIS